MNLFGVMEIAGSGLGAERLRAEVVASNMANLETTHTPGGGPYRRKLTVFRAENASPFLFQLASISPSSSASATTAFGRVPGGVRIAQVVTDTSAPLLRYQPGHPDADSAGYVAYAIRNITPQIREKYFVEENGELSVGAQARTRVTIQRLNLLDDSRMTFMKGIDIIFCCNVLIYFDAASKSRVIQHFYNNLLPHGYLFLGHAESLFGINDNFHLIHLPATTAYGKGEHTQGRRRLP